MSGFRILLTSALRLFFSLIFPAYGSISAIESVSSGDDTQWLVYWLIFSVIQIVENLFWPVLQWLPLYQELKIALIAWLVLPQTKGALFVYEAVLQPGYNFIRREASKQPAIDNFLNNATGSQPLKQRSPEAEAEAVESRRGNLAQGVMSLSTRLESKLRSISNISDYKQRARAERAFDKDLTRISKLGLGGSDKSY